MRTLFFLITIVTFSCISVSIKEIKNSLADVRRTIEGYEAPWIVDIFVTYSMKGYKRYLFPEINLCQGAIYKKFFIITSKHCFKHPDVSFVQVCINCSKSRLIKVQQIIPDNIPDHSDENQNIVLLVLDCKEVLENTTSVTFPDNLDKFDTYAQELYNDIQNYFENADVVGRWNCSTEDPNSTYCVKVDKKDSRYSYRTGAPLCLRSAEEHSCKLMGIILNDCGYYDNHSLALNISLFQKRIEQKN